MVNNEELITENEEDDNPPPLTDNPNDTGIPQERMDKGENEKRVSGSSTGGSAQETDAHSDFSASIGQSSVNSGGEQSSRRSDAFGNGMSPEENGKLETKGAEPLEKQEGKSSAPEAGDKPGRKSGEVEEKGGDKTSEAGEKQGIMTGGMDEKPGSINAEAEEKRGSKTSGTGGKAGSATPEAIESPEMGNPNVAENPQSLANEEKKCPDRNNTEGAQEGSEVCCYRTCPYEHITLGEPEYGQIQVVGKNLLQLGQQLLKEMDFVEGVLEKFGPTRRCGEYSKDAKEQLERNIEAQSKRLSLAQGLLNEETQKANNLAQFGSGFGSPHVSPSIEDISSRHLVPVSRSSQSQDSTAIAQLSIRLDEVYSQVAKLQGTIEAHEGKLVEIYNNLSSMINGLFEDTSELRNEVNHSTSQLEEAQDGFDVKFKDCEMQITQLGKVIWELQCEVRAQMHFGRET